MPSKILIIYLASTKHDWHCPTLRFPNEKDFVLRPLLKRVFTRF